MSEHTGIAWTDATWNPIRGCSRVSEGCRNCYAERIAARFSGPGGAYEGLARRRSNGEAQWTGEVRFIESHLYDPLRWKTPRRVFVNSMSDLFHENLATEVIDAVFTIMQASPMHTFQVLTKRPARMLEYLSDRETELRVAEMCETLAGEMGWCHANDDAPWPLANVWLGVSVENQAAADERIPLLLQTPAEVRFLSCEPLLGPVDLGKVGRGPWFDSLNGWELDAGGMAAMNPARMLGWVIVGGESGRGYRPMDLAWLRSIVEQCKSADVPVFVKQDSEPLSGKQGRIPDELWIREFPSSTVAA